MSKSNYRPKRNVLPKNYNQIISETLSGKGIQIKPSQVSDLIRGKNKNVILGFAVWTEVRKLEKEMIKNKKALAALKASKVKG
ncbi:MAG: hypothetical protein ACTHMC_01650 [Pseudobacter sp.]|uniref:hypothetical protein n=1 Tax=Pseudobacter sp. TaxID=2045420 RepID=UPI003F7EC1BD